MEAAATAASDKSTTSSVITRSKKGLVEPGERGKSFRLRSSRSLNSVRLRRIFDLFDKNGDGIITLDELSQALTLLGLEADSSELESTIKPYIRPGTLGLDYHDFEGLHDSLDSAIFDDRVEGDHFLSQNKDDEEEEERDLTEAFKVFDEDGDGHISAQELQAVLDKLGLPEAREMERVRLMIHKVDLNHDGLVDFFEFKDMMRATLLVHSS